ncbi:SCAN domain-containing protein 3-like [Oratosquilla oratoria]|uniref:SCAN domain-containing protein 3-like n=1 Tax=Oratosquilla oratoria TaxID=337810 RepID=UPI003F77656F
MDDHREHMSSVINDLLSSKRSCLIQDDKFQSAINILQGSSPNMDPRLKHWVVKQKHFELKDIPRLGLKDVLVVPTKCKEKTANSCTYLRVVPVSEVFNIVKQVHQDELQHGGYKKVTDYVSKHYYGIPRGFIQEFCKSCPICQLKQPQTTQPPLHPIIESGLLARVQVDLIDMQHTPDREYKWICHFMDHSTKFHIIFPLTSKDADVIAYGLQERVLAYLGPPKIFHSNSGWEFVNCTLPALMEQWKGEVTFIWGHPRHSQSQGLVGSGNQMIEQKLATLKADLNLEPDDEFHWAQHLPYIMYTLNTQRSDTTGKTPYELVFGQAPHLASIADHPLKARPNHGVVPSQFKWSKKLSTEMSIGEEEASEQVEMTVADFSFIHVDMEHFTKEELNGNDLVIKEHEAGEDFLNEEMDCKDEVVVKEEKDVDESLMDEDEFNVKIEDGSLDNIVKEEVEIDERLKEESDGMPAKDCNGKKIKEWYIEGYTITQEAEEEP